MKKVISIFISFMMIFGILIVPPLEVQAAQKDQLVGDYDVIFSNFNIKTVYSGPIEKYTGFTLNKDVVIKSITTYHYKNGQKTPGQIALADSNGKVYGPWKATGREGQAGVKNAYWDVFVDIPLKASDKLVYGITVSDTSGWSYNDDSDGQGFVEVRGYYVTNNTLDIPITTQNLDKPKENTTKETKPVEQKQTQATLKQQVLVNKRTNVGDLSKNDWAIAFPENTFPKNTDITVNFLADTSKYKKTGVNIIGPAIDVKADNMNSTRLNKPATLTMKMPSNIKITDSNIDDYVAGYWTGKEWDYIYPDLAELKKGIVKFDTLHFSTYAFMKLDESEKIKQYVKQMAVQRWADKNNSTVVMQNIEDTFKVAFEKMGLSDKTAQGEIIRAITSESDFGSLIVSAERGDVVSYTSKCGEMVANAIIQRYKNDDSYLKSLAGKGAAAATGVGKGLVQVYDGNYKKAAEELSMAFVNYFPYGRAFNATKDTINKGINQWKDSELEYAYRSYTRKVGDGVYGFKNGHDWNALIKQIDPAVITRMQLEAKQAHAAEKGISIDEVYKNKALSDKLNKEVIDNLKKSFEKRITNEENIKNREAEYTKIVQGFIKDGLLTRGQFRFDSGTEIEVRLRSLFAIRDNILGIFDGKMPVLKIGESSEKNLNEAISMWIQYGSKDRDKFYTWLEKKGYFGSSKNVTEEDPNANNPFKQGPVTPHGSGSPFDVIPGNGTKNP